MIYVTKNYRIPMFDEINSFYKQNNSTKEMEIDLFGDEKNYYIKTNLPGYSKDEISISFDENAIVIMAEHSKENKENSNVYIKERYSGIYKTKIALTQNCDRDNIEANLENGVLTIKIGKRAKAQKRKIAIN